MPALEAACRISLRRGGVQHGRWEKASPEHPLRVYDKTGAEMLFNRGKTYLAIVDDDEWSNFSYQ